MRIIVCGVFLLLTVFATLSKGKHVDDSFKLQNWVLHSIDNVESKANHLLSSLFEYMTIGSTRVVSAEQILRSNLRRYFVSLQSTFITPSDNVQPNNIKSRTEELEFLPTGLSYVSAFENYVLKDRPFKSSAFSAGTAHRHDTDHFVFKAPPSDKWIHALTNTSSLTHFVPTGFAVNNYLRRLPSSLHETGNQALQSVFGEYSDCISAPCLLDLTALQKQDLTHKILLQCPLGAHMLLYDPHISYSDGADEAKGTTGSINVHLYEDTTTNIQYGPVVSESSSSDGLAMSYLQYLPPQNKSPSKTASISGILKSGEYLFVPHPYHVHAISADETNAVYMLCVMDASNLHHLRSHLQALAPISNAHALLEEVFSSPQFDLTMQRNPVSALSAAEYTHYVLNGKLTSNSDASVSEGTPSTPAATVEDTASTATAATGSNRRDRRQRRKGAAAGSSSSSTSDGGTSNDFKSWQQQKQWKALIDSLLMTSFAPTSAVSNLAVAPHNGNGDSFAGALALSEISRTSVTLRFNHAALWQQQERLQIAHEEDQTPWGYVAVLCHLKPKDSNEDILLLDDHLRIHRRATASSSSPSTHTYRLARTPAVTIHNVSSLSNGKQVPTSTDEVYCEERRLPVHPSTQRTPDFPFVFSQTPGSQNLRALTKKTEDGTTAGDNDNNNDNTVPLHVTTQSWRLSGLLSNASYQVKIALTYGTRQGPFTAWSPKFTTASKTSPSVPLKATPALLQQLPQPFLSEIYDAQGSALVGRAELAAKPRNVTTSSVQAYRPGFPYAHSVSFSAELLFQAPLDDGDDLSSNSNNANDGSARGYYVYQFAHVLHPKMVGIREEAEAKYGSAEGEINSEEWTYALEAEEAHLQRLADHPLDPHNALEVPRWTLLGAFEATAVTVPHPDPKFSFLKHDTTLRRISIHNLQPDTFYSFRVAAYNEQGMSPISVRSNFVVLRLRSQAQAEQQKEVSALSWQTVSQHGGGLVIAYCDLPSPSPSASTSSSSSSSAAAGAALMNIPQRLRLPGAVTVAYTSGHPFAYGALTTEHARLLVAHHSQLPTNVIDSNQSLSSHLLPHEHRSWLHFDDYFYSAAQHRLVAEELLQQFQQRMESTALLEATTEETTEKDAVALALAQQKVEEARRALGAYTTCLVRLSLVHTVVALEHHRLYPLRGVQQAPAEEMTLHQQHQQQVFPVWAAHWSLYTSSYTSAVNGHQDTLDDSSRGTSRKEVREDVRKAALALVDIVAEACHLLYHPSVSKVVNEGVQISSGKADDKEVDGGEEEVIPAFWSPETFSPSPSSASSASAGQACQGRVAFIARGPAPLYHLALEAQARGAQGVVIYDAAGLCSSSGFDQRCVPGANRHFDEGFAAADVPDYWRDVTIPVVLMQREAFAQVRSLLQNQTPTPPHPQSVPGNVRGGRDEL